MRVPLRGLALSSGSLGAHPAIFGALWFAEGAEVLNFDNLSCDVFTASLQEVCNETQAIMGIAFGAWIIRKCPILLTVGTTLCVFAFGTLIPRTHSVHLRHCPARLRAPRQVA